METPVLTEPSASERVKMLTHSVDNPQLGYRVECIPPSHHLLLDEPRTENARVVRIAKRNWKHPPEGIFLPDVEQNSAIRAHFAEFAANDEDGLTIYRSEVPSDLAALRPRHGVMFETTDCLLVVATGGNSRGMYCVAGRACLDSLVRSDRSDRFESLVHGLVVSFDNKGIAQSNITLAAYFGTQLLVSTEIAERLTELEYQARSRIRDSKRWKESDLIVRTENGTRRASLYHILKAQALMEGIKSITYLKPLPRNEAFAHAEHENPDLRDKRNWVFAYRER